MLGALSLPSVSTGFSSDSKSMVPVSIQGMADKVEMSLNVHSMEDILMDVRDAIHNTSLAALKSFTMLQETMINGFTMLSNGLMNIGAIANKDLELEETQTNIDIENEKDEDREESLSGPTGGGLFTDKFKGGITKTLNKIKDLSLVESLIALGAGLFLLTANFDAIGSIIGKTLRLFDEEILPRGKAFFSTMKEYVVNLYDGFFGETGVFTVVFEGLKNIDKAVEKGDTKEAILAIGDMLLKSTLSIISLAGTSTLGLLKVAVKTIDPDADTSKLDEIIAFFDELPNKVIEKLKADQKEYLKVLEEEGYLTAQVVFFRQIYDNFIGNTLNGISRVFGIILKPIIPEDLYDTFMTIDYKSASIKSALDVGLKQLGNIFDRMGNAINIFINDTLDSINSFLPKSLQIDYRMPVKAIEGQNVYVDEEGMTVPMFKKAEIGKDINVFGEKSEKSIEEIVKDQVLGEGYTEIDGKRFYFEKQPLSNKELEELMNNKDNEKKRGRIEILYPENVDDKSSIVAPIFDNKTITTNNSSSQNVTVTNQRVDPIEPSSNALLAYFRQ